MILATFLGLLAATILLVIVLCLITFTEKEPKPSPKRWECSSCGRIIKEWQPIYYLSACCDPFVYPIIYGIELPPEDTRN